MLSVNERIKSLDLYLMLKNCLVIRFFNLVLLLNVWAVTNSFCQVSINPLIKVGGFIYAFPEYSEFSLHFEAERAFRKRQYFTSGLRLDYINPKNADKNFFIGYNLKLYPFYFKYKIPYRGFYIGVEPMYLVKSAENPKYRYGPGLGVLFGFQYLIKDRISLGLEADVMYVQNLNRNSTKYRGYSHPSERYFYLFSCVKVGIKLRK